ncbi:hypothetical protein [Gephyromycinifex aptenodytis]|nr:hypothetical protein [Gephyromycinifex aptenodytis]
MSISSVASNLGYAHSSPLRQAFAAAHGMSAQRYCEQLESARR